MIVLTYHSHNLSGNEYTNNDHVAFARDLEVIAECGARIVPLEEIARIVREERVASMTENLVGLSFDDGPVFDFEDFHHEQLGPQKSFATLLREFRARHGNAAQPRLHATSFVIASPEAREAMARAPECGFPRLEGWLGERWWKKAVDEGLLGIGNHSWDHVHGAPARIATRFQDRNDFMRVASYEDADAEVRVASEYINKRVGGACRVFAYPFGHVNEYLANEYFPRYQDRHGMIAAFGTGGRAIHGGDPAWNIPRAVCGEHWRSPAELAALIRS